MLNKLISRLRKEEEGHPLGSEKRIAEVLAEIRPSEGEGAVLDVDHWLLDAEHLAKELDPVGLRRAVMRLDEFVQEPLQATWSAWFDSSNRLCLTEKGWQTLVVHQEAVTVACQLCLADPDLLKQEDKLLVPILAARQMRAMVQGKKLQRLRYRAPDAAWWERAGKLLAWARERGASQTQIAVYPGEAPSSVWREYLIGVYLDLAPLDSMQQRQIEETDALLRKFNGALVVRAQPAGSEVYCLDPSSVQGPFRRDAARSYPPAVGYVGFESLRAQIVRLLPLVRGAREGLLPDWLQHAHGHLPQVLELLQTLAVSWSSDPMQRRSVRKNSEGMAKAVFGFSLLRRMAACSALARSGRRIDYDTYLDLMRRNRFGTAEGVGDMAEVVPDPEIPPDPMDVLGRLEATGQQQMMESWRVRDVSEGGLGVQMPHILGRHTIGQLVGFRLENDVNWQAGIIRRLRRDASGRSLAGIERLPGPPACAQAKALQQVDHGPWSELKEISGHGFIDAILLPGARPEVLLPAGSFSADAAFRLVVEGQSRNIRLLTLVGHDGDYERIAFQELAAPAA